MAHSGNIVNISIGDIDLNDDILVVYFKKTKTDQEGNDILEIHPYSQFFHWLFTFYKTQEYIIMDANYFLQNTNIIYMLKYSTGLLN